TIIGFGAPNKKWTADVHGAPLGADEIAGTRKALGWTHEPFVIPDDIRQGWEPREEVRQHESDWTERQAAYEEEHPELAAELHRRLTDELPADFTEQSDAYIRQCHEKCDAIATRKASQNALNAFGPLLPEMIGGSADLGGSNLTVWSGCRPIAEQADG